MLLKWYTIVQLYTLFDGSIEIVMALNKKPRPKGSFGFLAIVIVIVAAFAFGQDWFQTRNDTPIEVAFPHLSFMRPVDLQHAGDSSGRLFIVEQRGRIFVFPNEASVPEAEVFLDIRSRVFSRGNERGLLGLAFHPDYAANGYLFVNYTAENPKRTVIARFQVDSTHVNRGDVNSEVVLLEIDQPYGNHNGGQIAFGPDGYLYIALGDGGSAGDPEQRSKNPAELLGSILRIDVDHPADGKNYGIPADNPFVGNTSGYHEEIYAYGLRNPWRFSFDPDTGQLWAGDVGQNRREEVDIIVNGGNYGWDVMEGNDCFEPRFRCDKEGLIPPVWEYGRRQGGSITGGYVYRGERRPELVGSYIYADYVSGRIWALRQGEEVENTLLMDSDLNISSFGVDANRELYFCAFDGKIYRFASQD